MKITKGGGRVAGAETVAEVAKAKALRPTREEFKKLPGYYERPKPEGGYEWGCKFQPNDGHGKLTKQGAQVQEMLMPSIRADAERGARMQASEQRVMLRDHAGAIRYIEASRAGETARRHGWSHVARVGGLLCKAGPNGMLFRLVRDEWEPTGKLTIGVMGKPCPRRGLQFDPDNVPWRWFKGEWVKA